MCYLPFRITFLSLSYVQNYYISTVFIALLGPIMQEPPMWASRFYWSTWKWQLHMSIPTSDWYQLGEKGLTDIILFLGKALFLYCLAKKK